RGGVRRRRTWSPPPGFRVLGSLAPPTRDVGTTTREGGADELDEAYHRSALRLQVALALPRIDQRVQSETRPAGYLPLRQPGVLREAHEREPAPGKFCDDGRGPPTDGGPRRPITQIGEHIAARLPEYLVVAQHPYDVAAHRPRVLAPPGLRLAFGHLIHVDV